MNESFRAAMRWRNLSGPKKWLVSNLGRTVETVNRNGANYQIVEFRGQRYMKTDEPTAPKAAGLRTA
ncbi:hypothetical protein HKCCE3408_01000 [Rhodobacterales bacterium HKCCE3408]|nr:hypothetical protein [Rhodobacterales bacterium HKCCE3408]